MPRLPARVWLSRGLSNVYDAVRILREADTHGELTVLASHLHRQAPAMQIAHEGFLEPRLPDDEFVDWCLAACVEHRVDAFLPGRRVPALAAARERFATAGTRLMVPGTAETLGRIDRKDLFYEDMRGQSLPDYRIVRTAEEFDAACAELRDAHPRICVKPVVSTFGLGFHTLVGEDDEYRRFLGGNPVPVSMEAARRAIAAATDPRDLMVMEYLPGPERSVDCVAKDGVLVAGVARLKRADYQVIETSGAAIEAARAVVARYRLDGIVNVQTRDGRGEARLLEANARMSGGMLYACASGVAFPWWAVRLALGLSDAADVPAPRAGVCVAPVQGMIIVGNAPEIELVRRSSTRTSSVR